MNNFLTPATKNYLIPSILLVGLLVLGFMVMREFLLTVTWALIISYVTWPLYLRLRCLLKNNTVLSAAVMTIVMTVIIMLAASWMVVLLQEELKLAYQNVIDGLQQSPYQLPVFIRRIPWLGDYAQQSLDQLIGGQEGMKAQLAGWVKQGLQALAQFLGSLGKNFLKLGVVLATVFFCFRDGDEAVKQVQQGLVRFLGDHQQAYLQAAGNTTRAVVYGLTLAALGQGVLAGIGYAMVDIKAAVLLGTLTALFALIPMGATLVWLPMAILLVVSNQLWQGIGLFLWGFLVVSTVDNVIRPLVISGASRVPFLVVMFGVFGGLSAFGAVGLFLGPVILAVLLTVWQVWLQQ